MTTRGSLVAAVSEFLFEAASAIQRLDVDEYAAELAQGHGEVSAPSAVAHNDLGVMGRFSEQRHSGGSGTRTAAITEPRSEDLAHEWREFQKELRDDKC